MSKITGLIAENYKRLVAIEIHPGPTLTEIRGKNGAGKSTALDAVQFAICGKACLPEMPIRAGQDSAKVILDTTEHKVTRRLSLDDDGQVRDRLELVSKETGAKVSKPQTVLDALFGSNQADPLRFARLKAKDRADLLREVTGLDTRELDGERQLEYDRRTIQGREVKMLEGKLEGFPEPAELPAPEAEIDTTELMADLEQAHDRQKRNDNVRRELKTIRETITARDAEIEKLQKQLDKLEEERESLRERQIKGEDFCNRLEDPDTSAILAEAEKAKTHNVRVRVQREKKAEQDRLIDQHAVLKQQLKQARERWAAHEHRISEIDAEKAKLLSSSKLPAGLTFKGDDVFLDGVPFDQASQAQKVMLGFRVTALDLQPNGLRTILCRDGSLLDDDTRKALAVWACENDVQILLEVVGDGPGGIVIENGRVKS